MVLAWTIWGSNCAAVFEQSFWVRITSMQGFKNKKRLCKLGFLWLWTELSRQVLFVEILCNFKPENWILKYCGVDSDKHQNWDLKIFEKLYLTSLKWDLNSHPIKLTQWTCSSILKWEREHGGKDNGWHSCNDKRNVAEANPWFLFITEKIV